MFNYSILIFKHNFWMWSHTINHGFGCNAILNFVKLQKSYLGSINQVIYVTPDIGHINIK